MAARCALVVQEIKVRFVEAILAFVLIVGSTGEKLRSRRVPILPRRAALEQFGRTCGHRLRFRLALHLRRLLNVGVASRFIELAAIQVLAFSRQSNQLANSMGLLSAVL